MDAISWAIKKAKRNKNNIETREPFNRLDKSKKLILVTMHRRESFGNDLQNVCDALKFIAQKNEDIQVIYPVHLNPNVRLPVYEKLGRVQNIILTDPIEYESFIWLMNESYFIITDSGGIQEEAPSFKKPVLVIRKKTERMESVNLGISRLVGTDKDSITDSIFELLNDDKIYKSMISKNNPYGDGRASEIILNSILQYFQGSL